MRIYTTIDATSTLSQREAGSDASLSLNNNQSLKYIAIIPYSCDNRMGNSFHCE